MRLIFFCKIILILLSIWLTAAATVSLPPINSSVNASMATILVISLLFSETGDTHGFFFIVLMSGFEILFQSEVNRDYWFWFVIRIIVSNFGLICGKSSILFWVGIKFDFFQTIYWPFGFSLHILLAAINSLSVFFCCFNM